MEKLSVSKEFVLAAHKAACSEWRSKIKEQFPDLFVFKLELGAWYEIVYTGQHCCGIDYSAPASKVYTVRVKEFLHSDTRVLFDDTCGQEILFATTCDLDFVKRKLTKEEIEKHLDELRIKKGFKEGGSCFWPDIKITHKNLQGQPKYNHDNDCLSFSGCIVYHDGKWGQAISGPAIVEITMDEIAKLKGCDVSQLKIKK